MAGYPRRRRDPQATQMFQSNGRILGSALISSCTNETPDQPGTADGSSGPLLDTSLLILHTADSENAQSGGPVFVLENGVPKLVAIHTGFVSGGCFKQAVLLSPSVQAQIQDWMRRSLRRL